MRSASLSRRFALATAWILTVSAFGCSSGVEPASYWQKRGPPPSYPSAPRMACGAAKEFQDLAGAPDQFHDLGLAPVLQVQPDYPPLALYWGEEGWVDFRYSVSPQGKPCEVQVVGASTHGVFDESAYQAMRQWRFNPAKRNGTPLQVNGVTTRLTFRVTPGAGYPTGLKHKCGKSGYGATRLAPRRDEDGPSPLVVPKVRLKPNYPEKLRAREVEGWAEVSFTIARDGTLCGLRAVNGAPNHLFDREAVRTISTWTYVPPVLEGRPIAVSNVKSRLYFLLR